MKLGIAVLFGLMLATLTTQRISGGRRHSDYFSRDAFPEFKNPRKTSLNNFFDSLLPNSLSHLVRPLFNLFEDASSGLSSGFLNVDLDLPFFCLTDGLSTA